MNNAVIVRYLAAMGTALSLTVSAPTRGVALAASEAGVREIERIEALLSTWREDTPLARLNAAASRTTVELPAELFELLKRLFDWRERTGGAFDPTVAPLVKAWGVRNGGRIPGLAELLAARRVTGPSLFSFEESSSSVSRRDALAGIDEGAWGKGWALDRAAAAMRNAGAVSGLLDLGGQVLAFGDEIFVDVADPFERKRTVTTLRLKDASASTSGNSERGLVVNGRRIGHLLDPRTGEPASDFGSVTVVSKDGLTADVLSTAFFVLGEKKGLALSQRLRADGVVHETLYFLESEAGQSPRASMSPGMERFLDSRPSVTCDQPSHDARSPRIEPLPLTHSKESEGALHP